MPLSLLFESMSICYLKKERKKEKKREREKDKKYYQLGKITKNIRWFLSIFKIQQKLFFI